MWTLCSKNKNWKFVVPCLEYAITKPLNTAVSSASHPYVLHRVKSLKGYCHPLGLISLLTCTTLWHDSKTHCYTRSFPADSPEHSSSGFTLIIFLPTRRYAPVAALHLFLSGRQTGTLQYRLSPVIAVCRHARLSGYKLYFALFLVQQALCWRLCGFWSAFF